MIDPELCSIRLCGKGDYQKSQTLTANDPEICVIKVDDKPIIPKGEKNLPIIQALKELEERRGELRLGGS